MRIACPLIALVLLIATPAVAGEAPAPMSRLVAAYPDFLAGEDGKDLLWKDGTRMPLADGREAGKSFDEKLKSASLTDQMSLPYPAGSASPPRSAEDDPGRFRNIAFFDKMYGDCSKGQVQKTLVTIQWMPKSGGKPLSVSRINGVAERLKAVSDELDSLPEPIRKYAYPSAGTYNCRVVADTGIRSAHAFGIAIDLNTSYSDYWLWAGKKGAKEIPYKNRIPKEIVAAFEAHGFIWGGRWGHYDTMHFEYRPELLPGFKP